LRPPIEKDCLQNSLDSSGYAIFGRAFEAQAKWHLSGWRDCSLIMFALSLQKKQDSAVIILGDFNNIKF